MPEHQRRSRTGCDECRRRHWKCNEAKPACAYCQSIGRTCVYTKTLSWGGRPFRKSRFGQCLTSGARAVSSSSPGLTITTSGDFIYTCSPRPAFNERRVEEGSRAAQLSVTKPRPPPACATSGPGISRTDGLIIGDDNTQDSSFSFDVSLNLRPLAVAPSLPQECRPLFDHFLHGVTVSISCHKGIQDAMCSAIIPMALEVPHLLSGVLALAAAHRTSSGIAQRDPQFEFLKGKSLSQLRSALHGFTPIDNDQFLATTLVLCMVEVISPHQSTASWKSHLDGAAVFASHQSSSLSSTSTCLRRKFQALQAMALANGSKPLEGHILVPTPREEDAHIDDLAGYSTALLPIFQAINDLDKLRVEQDPNFSCEAPPDPPHFDCTSSVEHQSHLLFDRIQNLMADRDLSRTPRSGSISPAIYNDLWLLDEAYHHMAILQVSRRGSLSIPRQMIEESIQVILDRLASISYESGPCPGVAALPPLFIAGILSNTSSDRNKVRHLLKTLWVNYGMGNVRSCRTVLETRWKQQDENSEKPGVLTSQIFDEYDVLPY